MKRKYFSLLLAIAMLCNFIMPFTAFANESTSKEFEYLNFTVNYIINNSWENNQNVEIKITNTGSETIQNWAMKFDPCGTITGLWGAELSNDCVIKNAYYNADIAVGSSINFGYTLTGVSGIPSDFSLCSSYKNASIDGYTVDLSVINDWDSGFCGLITINNNKDTPIMGWELSFSSNFSIINT